MKILDLAGLSSEEQTLCRTRFKESGLKVSYTAWCKGYVLLNSTKTAEELGLQSHIPALQQAFIANVSRKLAPMKQHKAVKIKLGK